MSNRFEIMEKRDEEQILAEAQGTIIKEMFYKFTIGGKEVTGISWVGTKEIARKYGGIRMGLPNVTELEHSFVCSIQAEDTRNEITLVGSSQQLKNITLKSGEVKPDPFAYVKCVSKAQRNAIRSLIPETFLLEMEKAFSSGTADRVHSPRKAVDLSEVDYSVSGIKAYFEQLGYDPDKFTIRHDEPSRQFVLDKIPSIPTEEWQTYLDDVRELGGEYNREYKKTVFRY